MRRQHANIAKDKVTPELEVFDREFQETIRTVRITNDDIWLKTNVGLEDLEIVLPGLDPDAWKAKPTFFTKPHFQRESFYSGIVSDQIQRASKARGRLLRPGEDPAFTESWAGYQRSVLYNINSVNECLQKDADFPDSAPGTLPILQLLLCDLRTALYLWKAHLRGFFAYVEFRGGASKLMTYPKPIAEMSRLYPIMMYVTYESHSQQ